MWFNLVIPGFVISVKSCSTNITGTQTLFYPEKILYSHKQHGAKYKMSTLLQWPVHFIAVAFMINCI